MYEIHTLRTGVVSCYFGLINWLSNFQKKPQFEYVTFITYLIDPIVIYIELNESIFVCFPRIFKPEQYDYVTRVFTTLRHLLKPV